MFQAEYTPFRAALAAGQQNEQVVAEEFEYRGLPIIRADGKAPFDFKLPSGQLVEVKLDLRSQRTANGVIEANSLARPVDFFIHTFTYARVYTAEEYRRLYDSGKVPTRGIGEFHYDARYIPKL